RNNHDVDTSSFQLISPKDENQVPDGAEGGKDGTNEGVVAQHPPNDEDYNEDFNEITT
ncbi:hypothetical protein MKX03_011349, partial [Papaver bracteatum]